ncbi:L,D-transpeptidase family protein [Streptomyces sp. GSL17-111]|uniref:L,D-transpeptidase family protein n=1 Tax=Streptomyces sp. GSL17-111 TaxID=3121596 RepID=UPI0030F3C800
MGRGSARRRTAVALLVTTAFVAPAGIVATAAPAQAAPYCNVTTGSHQRQVERFLKLAVDGRQSLKDCRAIQAFQTRHGIAPNAGWAGPITWGVMHLMNQQKAAGKNPNKSGRCPTNKGRIACVDLTRQLSWIQDGRKLVHGPVPVRTGRNGHETRTGAKKVYWRNKNHWSTLYDVAMPYAQFFDGGIAFHSIKGSVWSPPGSHGCVNMRRADAATYWSLLRNGDDVHVWGRKPGT